MENTIYKKGTRIADAFLIVSKLSITYINKKVFCTIVKILLLNCICSNYFIFTIVNIRKISCTAFIESNIEILTLSVSSIESINVLDVFCVNGSVGLVSCLIRACASPVNEFIIPFNISRHVWRKWTRRESNPCPKTDPRLFYERSLFFIIPLMIREQTL